MQLPIRHAALLLLALTAASSAQTVVETDYQAPAIKIAPGQVVPLIVTGLQTILPDGIARVNGPPVPLTLDNISVTLTEPPTSYSAQLPIFSINQFNHCGVLVSPSPACRVTAITVQIPFDIFVPNPAQVMPFQPSTVITINQDGTISQAFFATPYPDRVHILQSCDIAGQTFETGVCYPLVTHADGSLVLQDASGSEGALTRTAAQPGEALVMYAWGLGTISPAVQAGSVSPIPPATVVAPVNLRFDYIPNASPSPPTANVRFTSVSHPFFAGLTPTEVGLYQINFVVPDAPPGAQNCGAPIASNLTISVDISGQSFSGAAICVDVN
jgi:uncharacterized protein (TIGR03437 family)